MTAIARPTTTTTTPGPTGLMKHLIPFDANHDGIVTRKEAADFIHDLGLGWVSSELAATIINGAFAKPTTGKAFPLNVAIANIAAAKHPGDSKVYDAQGNVDPQKFDALWSNYDPSGKGYLTKDELLGMIKKNSATSAPADQKKGMIASGLEFILLLNLTSEVNTKGELVLTKATLHSFYDGTLFGQIAADRRALLDAVATGKDAPQLSRNSSIAALGMAAHLSVPLDEAASNKALMATKHIGPVIWAAVANAFS
jgi:hypothetical protein